MTNLTAIEYGQNVEGTVETFTPEAAALIIERIQRKISDLGITRRVANQSTTAYAQGVVIALTDEIAWLEKDIKWVKAHTVAPKAAAIQWKEAPMRPQPNQYADLPNGNIVRFIGKKAAYGQVKVALKVNGVDLNYQTSATFEEAKSLLWQHFCSERNMDTVTGRFIQGVKTL